MSGVEFVASWLTPTVLFCVLNLMIGTIFITSSLKPQQKHQNLGENDDLPPPQLARVPSFLERVKSINLSRYRSEQTDHQNLGENDDLPPPQLARVPSLLERVKSINLSRYWSEQTEPVHYTVPAQEQAAHQVDPKHENEETHHVPRTRSKSDTAAHAAPAERVLKKSASEKVAPEAEVEVDQRRPATVREKTASFREEDEAVDAKADDFINRFRQQLKLQRLDSILRYRETLNGGTRS